MTAECDVRHRQTILVDFAYSRYSCSVGTDDESSAVDESAVCAKELIEVRAREQSGKRLLSECNAQYQDLIGQRSNLLDEIEQLRGQLDEISKSRSVSSEGDSTNKDEEFCAIVQEYLFRSDCNVEYNKPKRGQILGDTKVFAKEVTITALVQRIQWWRVAIACSTSIAIFVLARALAFFKVAGWHKRWYLLDLLIVASLITPCFAVDCDTVIDKTCLVRIGNTWKNACPKEYPVYDEATRNCQTESGKKMSVHSPQDTGPCFCINTTFGACSAPAGQNITFEGCKTARWSEPLKAVPVQIAVCNSTA